MPPPFAFALFDTWIKVVDSMHRKGMELFESKKGREQDKTNGSKIHHTSAHIHTSTRTPSHTRGACSVSSCFFLFHRAFCTIHIFESQRQTLHRASLPRMTRSSSIVRSLYICGQSLPVLHVIRHSAPSGMKDGSSPMDELSDFIQIKVKTDPNLTKYLRRSSDGLGKGHAT